MEPCAGDGAIISLVPDVDWFAFDIRPETRLALEALNPMYVGIGDALQVSWPQVDVMLTNPPFNLAVEFITKGLAVADHTVCLLRLNFLGGAERCEWLQRTRPDVWVLPQRPSFANKCRGGCKLLLPPDVFQCPCGAKATPQTDSTEYAWFHWHAQSSGIIRVLNLTPLEERRRVA